MAGKSGSDETGRENPGGNDAPPATEADLARRTRALEAAIAARRPPSPEEGAGQRSGGWAGAAQGLKLSSEFVAGVVVGGGLGWFIDRLAGTSPFGLIVFLLLGFAAGVLNVLRSIGQVAEFGVGRRNGRDDDVPPGGRGE